MKQHSLERGGAYSVDFVLSQIYIPEDSRLKISEVKKLSRKEIDGKIATFFSERLIVFKSKGTKCCKCGLEGKFFALERFPSDSSYHFNLYGINDLGEEILMTKDHIIPIASGGKNHIDNYQPMCSVCNCEKGSGD